MKSWSAIKALINSLSLWTPRSSALCPSSPSYEGARPPPRPRCQLLPGISASGQGALARRRYERGRCGCESLVEVWEAWGMRRAVVV
ncbi:hypothetical protein C8F04DRAFT_352183 [Mycena alexandri]|uniref:Secreted protein n=1 Tax=Mycena alexandri TaxID=1745969 RepID=A0AAD6S0W4_9AGAR|nr:hypothetical protein C8F04DRAFT_352183 [Mycena alexandri]